MVAEQLALSLDPEAPAWEAQVQAAARALYEVDAKRSGMPLSEKGFARSRAVYVLSATAALTAAAKAG